MRLMAAAVFGLTTVFATPSGGGNRVVQLQCEVVIAPTDSSFGRIGFVAPGPGGRLAWTDGPGQFLLRDAAGRIRTVGRTGSGPGEFSLFGSMEWLGDTLWVGDIRLARVQMFSDTGALIRVMTAITPGQWGARPSGRLVGPGRQLAQMILPWTVLSHQPGSTNVDTLAVFPLVPADRVDLPAGGRMISLPQPLSPETQFGASQDYARFCAARPAEPDAIDLKCVDDHGSVLLDRRVQVSPRPVTSAIYDSAIAAYRRGPVAESDLRSRISRPRYLPPVTQVMMQKDGGIWLRRSHRAEPSSVWLRLNADGSRRDEISIPATYRIQRVDVDWFWAVTADDDGMETLHRCR